MLEKILISSEKVLNQETLKQFANKNKKLSELKVKFSTIYSFGNNVKNNHNIIQPHIEIHHEGRRSWRQSKVTYLLLFTALSIIKICDNNEILYR